VFPTEVALCTLRKVGYWGKGVANFAEARCFLLNVVQIADIVVPFLKSIGIPLRWCEAGYRAVVFAHVAIAAVLRGCHR